MRKETMDKMEEKIRLTDQCRPVMKEGHYEVSVREEAEIGQRITFADQAEVIVTSRAFHLQPEEVYSVYPPKDSSGEYGGCMPHIVLNRDTIPWEREMFAEKTDRSCPWLMLLLLAEGEAFTKQELSIREAMKGKDHPLLYMGKQDGLTPDSLEQEEDSCTVLDISADLAAAILPDWEEAGDLCHGRLVSLEHKVTDASVRDGWFSCVTANRYADSQKGKDRVQYTACLISLKGFEELLEAKDTAERAGRIGKASAVRFFVLYEWEFACTSSPYDFASIIRQLTVGTLCGRIRDTVQTPQLRDLLERGFYPVNHRLRDGSRTVSWYRGPLLPQFEATEPLYDHVFSDQMSKYDPDMGMYDMSYATAWQLGRMLAFGDQSFCRSLIQWRFQNYRKAAGRQQAEQIRNWMQLDQENGGQEKELDELLAAQCRTLLQGGLMKRGSERKKPCFCSGRDMEKIDRTRYFASVCTKNSAAFPEEIRSFVMECSLLYHVPFWYLVPDAEMLKEEELRFFCIDADWILRLMDGMCSVGRNASIDYQHDTDILQQWFAQVMEESGDVRRQKQERNDPVPDAENGRNSRRQTEQTRNAASGTDPCRYTGFLLRSVLVKDFRGLEFEAYDAPEQGNRLETLRLDTLSNHVLLGIFCGEMKRLEIGQPPEGLHFGFDWILDGAKKSAVKYLRNPKDGKQNGMQAEVVLRGDERLQCIDVRRTKDAIAKKLGIGLGSAGFALSMIHNAHSGVFRMGE